MKRTGTLVLAALALLAAAVAVVNSPTASALEAPTPTFLTTAGPATTIIGEYPLTGGRLLVNFSMPGRNGWAVVLPGTQIGQEPVTLGEVREMLTVRPPEPSNGAEARLAAQQLAASGWTEDVQSALLELVGSGTPPVSAISQVEPQRSSAATEDPNPEKEHFAEACIYVDNPDDGTRAQGCYQRFWGQEDDYEAFTGSTSWAFAAADAPDLALTIVTTAHSYGNARMRQYDPVSPVDQGACSTVGLGLSGYGVSVSQSQQICPEKLYPTILNEGTVYGVDWRGTVTSGAQRHTELVEIARMDKAYPPNPSPAQAFGFAYHMDFRAENRCSAKPEDCFGGPGKLISDLITELLH